MANAVQAVVGEGESHDGLEQDLGGDGESTKGSDHGGRLQVPAKGRRCEIGGGPEVERTGEGDTADTVEGGHDPANLRTVDGQVGRNRSVQTLLGQYLVRIGSVGRRDESIDVIG